MGELNGAKRLNGLNGLNQPSRDLLLGLTVCPEFSSRMNNPG
jgi:hypothetical protein